MDFIREILLLRTLGFVFALGILAFAVLVFLVLFFGLLFLAAFLLLNLLVGQLVIDQVVQCNDGANERSGVDNKHLIVGVDIDGLDKLRVSHIRKQIENVLKQIGDLMVHGQLAIYHLLQVLVHVSQLHFQPLESHELVGNFLAQSAGSGILDVSKKMFDSNFFGFFSTNLRGDMFESFCRWGAIVMNFFNS